MRKSIKITDSQMNLMNVPLTKLDKLRIDRMEYYKALVRELKVLNIKKIALIKSYNARVKQLDEEIYDEERKLKNKKRR